MKPRKLFLWSVLIFAVLSLTLAIVAVAKILLRPVQQYSIPDVGKSVHQAARFIYYESPFYFPYKTRATTMIAANPFTEDSANFTQLNSNGFRTPEYTIAHPPDTFRIVIIGESSTYGGGVVLEQTYHYRLGKLLRQKCPQMQTEVIALSNTRHRFVDDFILLLAHGQFLKPDLVIFQLDPGDINFFSYLGFFVTKGIADPFNAYTRKEFEVLSPESMDWALLNEALEGIRDWAEKSRVPVHFLIFPVIDSGKTGRNFDHYNLAAYPRSPGLTETGRVAEEIRRHGFPVQYLLDTFREEAGDEYLALSEINGAANPFTHRLAARSLSSFLIEQHLFPCSKKFLRPADPEWKEESVLRNQAAEHWFEFNTNFQRQVDFFEDLQRLYPQSAWIASQRANSYSTVHRSVDSYETYASLLKLAPSFSAPWYHMARSTGREDLRRVMLETMLQAVPDHYGAMQFLSEVYLRRQDRINEACKVLGRLLEIPGSQEQYDSNKELYKKHACASRSTK